MWKIIHTFIFVLNEALFDGVIMQEIPSQVKCTASIPASFERFPSATVEIDTTEMTQDMCTELNKKADC